MYKLTIALATASVITSVIVAFFLISQFQNGLLAAFLTLSFIYFAASILLIFLPYFLTQLKGVGRNKSKGLGAKKETDAVKNWVQTAQIGCGQNSTAARETQPKQGRMNRGET